MSCVAARIEAHDASEATSATLACVKRSASRVFFDNSAADASNARVACVSNASVSTRRKKERVMSSSKSSKSSKSKSSKSVKQTQQSDVRIETHANGVKFSNKRPGVIACIVEMLRNANAETPISKLDILTELVRRFPERGQDKLQATLTMQVPSGLLIEKKIKVQTVIDQSSKVRRYWIDQSETDKLQAAYAARRVSVSELTDAEKQEQKSE